MSKEKIPAYNYLSGIEFTENLKHLANCRTFLELAEILDVPKATFSTWNTHNRTSHELMVRLHLRLGIPIEQLALYPEDRTNSVPYEPKTLTPENGETTSTPQRQTAILKSFCLTNGELLATGEVPYAVRRMNSFNLKAESTIEIETNEALFLVDNSSTNPASGKYLIDIDGTLSINHIQRLPGKKLAVVFGETTVEVAEEDIKVIGRVAVTLKKD